MRLGNEALADIVARSSTFHERLSNHTLIPVEGGGGNEADRRLQQWRTKAAHGDQRVFRQILAIQQLDESRALRALGKVRLADSASLPEWVEWLNEGLALAGAVAAEVRTPGSGARREPQSTGTGDPLPFEPILAPFVDAAAARLRSLAPLVDSVLPGEARAANEQALLRRLCAICRSALDMEFALFKLGWEKSPAERQEAHEPDIAFTHHMEGGGLVKFFTEYAVLAGAVPLLMRNWVEATFEFMERLERDRPQIEQRFLDGKSLGTIEALDAGLSDPHNHGRMVMAVSFQSGLKLLYKPKSLETEVAYSRLIDWVNGRGQLLSLQPMKVLSRDRYGWVEFIRHAKCVDDDETQRFYRRCGMLLALFHALGASDVHADNLIAAGEHPVMIDAETLITPDLDQRDELRQGEREGWAEARAARIVSRSVMRVAMLPWQRISNNVWIDPSALGARIGWDIQMPETGMTVGSTNHLPFEDPARRDIACYAEQVVTGFRELYGILLDGRQELLEADSPLHQLAGSAMRLIFRDTQIYLSLLQSSLDSRFVRDGADRSVQLESLSWLLSISEPRDRYLPVVEAERQAIERIDIPMFAIVPLACDLHTGPGQFTPDYFPRPCFEYVRESLARLGPDDMEEQERRIRGSFAAKRATMALQQMITLERTICPTPAARWDEREALASAIAVGDEFQKRAITGDDGSVTWEGAIWLPAHRLIASATAPTRYCEGLADAALFLAALEAADPAGSWRTLANGALRTLRRSIDTIHQRPGERNSKNYDLSFASLVFPLARIASLVNDEYALETANLALASITPAVLAADNHLNFVQGTAGFLLGALALDEINSSPEILDKAILCGEHLLARRSAWPSPNGKPRIGLALGLAGVTVALARLACRSGHERFLDAAKAAFRFELKQRAESAGDAGWADGQAGFGYACLAMLPHLGIEAEAALERAIDHAAASTCVTLDSLHSGVFGRADFLAEAGLCCNRPDLINGARALAAWSIERASQRGGYALIPGAGTDTWGPGLCFGAAGVGYTLLRLLAPRSTPSLVAWR